MVRFHQLKFRSHPPDTGRPHTPHNAAEAVLRRRCSPGSGLVHVLCAEAGEADAIERKGLAQRVDVLSDGFVVDLLFPRGQCVGDGADGCHIADVVRVVYSHSTVAGGLVVMS